MTKQYYSIDTGKVLKTVELDIETYNKLMQLGHNNAAFAVKMLIDEHDERPELMSEISELRALSGRR